MKNAHDVATEVFAELMRVSKQGGVVKSAAVKVIADALESFAGERSPERSEGLRPEVLAFARAIEQELRGFTSEEGHHLAGVYGQVDELRADVDSLEQELAKEKPEELLKRTAKVATTAFIVADNADQLSDVPLLNKDLFSRFHQSGGAELLAQLFHEARQDIVVDPQNRKSWEETGETTKSNLVSVCAAVLDALESETD